jgi:hypothetical protein
LEAGSITNSSTSGDAPFEVGFSIGKNNDNCMLKWNKSTGQKKFEKKFCRFEETPIFATPTTTVEREIPP